MYTITSRMVLKGPKAAKNPTFGNFLHSPPCEGKIYGRLIKFSIDFNTIKEERQVFLFVNG